MCCLLLVDQQNSWVSSLSSLPKRLVERRELNRMMVLTFECSAAFSTGGCFWSYFFSWKMDSTAVSAVGNRMQTHIERADVVVISDFQFIFIAPFKNIIRNICS